MTPTPNQRHLRARPAPSQRGASADRHETWAQDAMDAGSAGRFGAQRSAPARTVKSCGPGTPGLVLSRRATSLLATVTKRSWTPGRARSSSLKPSRRECRCNGWTCSDYAHVLPPFVHEAMGVAETPGIPCALCLCEAQKVSDQPGRHAPRESFIVLSAKARPL